MFRLTNRLKARPLASLGGAPLPGLRRSACARIALLFVLLLLLSLPGPEARAAGTPPAAVISSGRGLIERVLPRQARQFVVEAIPAEDGRDVFEIESRGQKIILRGDSGVAVASALRRYLADYCHAEPGWNCGEQMDLSARLPSVPEKVRVASPYEFRFDYNYCTHGYTFAWWDWPRWEHELDSLAMHGVNLALVIEGQEQVWIDALKQLGYSDAEVRQWLVLPTHQPWMFMSNMQDYGGPVPESLAKRRGQLARQIIDRMNELGIAPVLQGYYGIVPPDFSKRYPDAKVHSQGQWGTVNRPDMLDPSDPQFARLAGAFYRSQKQHYGRVSFLAADPFHEGGNTEEIDLAAAARAIYGPMSNAYPKVTWVFQSWQANPRQPMLDALDKSRCLVLDLYCEDHENWRSRNQFGNTPWLWCTIHNFGGNDFLAAKLTTVAQGPAKALAEAGPGKGFMRGLGGLMEGSDTHPEVWEMLFEQGWRTNAPDFNVWLDNYARCRYGALDSSARQALQTLFESAWNIPGGEQLIYNSVVCGRPSLDPDQRACAFCGTKPPFAEGKVAAAWKQLLDAAPACGDSDGYRYDVADVGREVLADLATHYHQAIVHAFADKDAVQLRRLSDKMLGLVSDMDQLAGTRKEFLLGPWLENARSWGQTADEKDRYERDARELVTVWCRGNNISDYANREWNGLLGNFYRERWEIWLAALNGAAGRDWKFDQQPVRKQIKDWEYVWTAQTDKYPTAPRGDTVAVARALYAKYATDVFSPARYVAK